MEFLVKIGADQQGLNDTLQRITAQFKNMNTSMPTTWGAQQSAFNQYGNIMKTASDQSGFQKFQQQIAEINPGLGSLAGKIGELAGPIGLVGAAVGSLGLLAKATWNQINEAYELSRQSRITGASAGMLDNVNLASAISGVEVGNALNVLNAQAGAFNAGDKGAQDLFNEIGINPSGKSVDDVLRQMKGKFAGITDPAKRARLAKGLFGKSGYEMGELLDNLDVGNTMLDSADIETLGNIKKGVKGWWERVKDNVSDAFREYLAITARGFGLGKNARRGEFSQMIGEEVELPAKKGKAFKLEQPDLKTVYLWSDGSKRDKPEPKEKTVREDKSFSAFQADQMAQAGLYSGSSLLFNPNLTIQQQQLDALQQISNNTAKIGEGAFS